MDVQDLKNIAPERLSAIKIGIENDNYLQYAIKNKVFPACVYLLTSATFDLAFQNGSGNNCLHLAVKTGEVRFLRLVLLKLAFLDGGGEQDYDMRCFNLKTLRDLSQAQNKKGLSPLMLAVDEGDFPVFRFLLELTYYHD